jgi:hypothetical protein
LVEENCARPGCTGEQIVPLGAVRTSQDRLEQLTYHPVGKLALKRATARDQHLHAGPLGLGSSRGQ